jgi:photosystem II stability/assembly factor-like uncharacterized protein
MQRLCVSWVSSLLLTACLCTAGSAQQTDGVESMKLIAPSVGWVATGSRVLWTADGGSNWKDITPKTSRRGFIASVFFLDTSTGWVLLSHNDSDSVGEGPGPELDLASTTDAGRNWARSRIKVPRTVPGSTWTNLSGRGWIDFVDASRGWIVLQAASSSAVSWGVLLRTEDGGRTWIQPPGRLPIADHIRFINAKDGWMAGGAGGDLLYVTRDGGNAWQSLSLDAPGNHVGHPKPAYDLPTFVASKDGFLPVTYSSQDESTATLVLFATADAGATWNTDRVLPGLPDVYGGMPLPSAVVGSALLTARLSDKSRLTLDVIGSGSKPSTVSAAVTPIASAVTQISFVGSLEGWVLASGYLWSTKNGGATWTRPSPVHGGVSTMHHDLGLGSSPTQGDFPGDRV